MAVVKENVCAPFETLVTVHWESKVRFGSGSGPFALNAEPERRVRFGQLPNLEPERAFRFSPAFERVRT